MYGNKLYGAGKARDRRCKVLKKLRVQRDTIPQRIKHGIDTFSVLDAEATKEQQEVHLRVLAEQKKNVEYLEVQLAIIEKCEAEVIEYGFQLVDSFNGNETVSTLTPESLAISEGATTGRYSGTGERGHLSEGDSTDIRKTAEAIQKVREESPVPISPAEAYKRTREKGVEA